MERTAQQELADIETELDRLYQDEKRIRSRISDLSTRRDQLLFEMSGQAPLPLEL